MSKPDKRERTLRYCDKAEVRAEERDGEAFVTGYPIVFNQKTRIRGGWDGDWDEVILPTALDGADLSDVFLFVNHNDGKIPLARHRNGRGTLALEIEPQGLRIDAKLDTRNNEQARALYSAVERGDISGMSFAFRIAKDTWTPYDKPLPSDGNGGEVQGLRTIEKIAIVHEVSAVNLPAYDGTVIATRSEQESFEAMTEVRVRGERLRLAKAKAKAYDIFIRRNK